MEQLTTNQAVATSQEAVPHDPGATGPSPGPGLLREVIPSRNAQRNTAGARAALARSGGKLTDAAPGHGGICGRPDTSHGTSRKGVRQAGAVGGERATQ